MLTSRFGFGYGMGYAAYSEACALANLGHSVTVVHCNHSPDLAQYHDPRIIFFHLPIKNIPLVGFFLFFFKIKRLLKEKIQADAFDVIYIQSLEFGLVNLAALGPPMYYFARSTMIRQHQVLRNEEGWISPLEKLIRFTLVTLERRCMRYSRSILVKSRSMAGEINRLYGIPKDKIAVVHGGIDLKDFQVRNKSSCVAFRHQFGIPQESFVVLYAGRIVPQKGLLFLIRAALALRSSFDFVVVIAGAIFSKSYIAKVKRLIISTGYEKSFYFLGHIDQLEMPVVFSSADCIVTPSLYEPFGMVNLQAAFLGKKIITTNVTGSVDLLAQYPRLKTVKAGSSSAIEAALREVLLQPSPAKPASLDLSMYSWRDVAEQLVRIFFASPSIRKEPYIPIGQD